MLYIYMYIYVYIYIYIYIQIYFDTCDNMLNILAHRKKYIFEYIF